MVWGLVDYQSGKYLDVRNAALSEASTQSYTSSVNGKSFAVIKAIVTNGASAGSLRSRWAQNSATAVNSKLLKNAYMKVE